MSSSKPGFVNDLGDELGKFVETGVSQIKPQPKASVSKSDQKEVVDFLYGKGKDEQPSPESPKAEDDEKLKKYRNELKNYLHSQYYQSLTTKKQEERPAEKIEREKKQENFELIQKEKKKPPLPVQRAQNIEKNRGSSG